jgi:hypothetical protein
METENKLAVIVQQAQLDKTKSDYILEKFGDYFSIAAHWEAKAKTLLVTDESQTDLMKEARQGRLELKVRRVELEKSRKELKEQSVREGKAIDGIANVLKALIVPIEEYLEKQENFITIKKEAEKQILADERKKILSPYCDCSLFNLGEMSEGQFQQLLSGQKAAYELQKENEKKAELERIEAERKRAEEQERIRQEIIRLSKEAEERERRHVEEMRIKEAERNKQLEIERKEREIREIELRKEREAKEKIESELRAKKEAERKLRAEEERKEKERIAAEKIAARAPDKTKLLLWIDNFILPDPPELQNDANQIRLYIIDKFADFKKWANKQIETL